MEKKYKHIRPLQMDDLDNMMNWVNNPEVTRNLAVFQGKPITREEEEKYLEKILSSENTKAFAILNDNGEYIGHIGLHRIYRRCEVNVSARLGVIIGRKEEWGKRYAQKAIDDILDYAFDENKLGLHKVWLMVNPDNEKNLHLYTKCGFKEEARLVQEYYHDEKFHDMIRMYMLKEDYNARKKTT